MAFPFGSDGTIWTVAGAALVAGAWLGHDLFLDRLFWHETGSAYGTAHWAKSRDLKGAGLFGSDGIVLGRHHGKLLRHQTDKHLLTLAPNRAGKGVSAIIPNLLTWPGSVLVIDPKGENAIVAARRRREMGQAVHVLDPWGITGLACGCFNPLLALAPDSADLVEDAALLADGLVLPATKADDEFWNGEARSLIAGLVMHIVTTELPEHRHLGTLRHILTLGEQDFAELLEDMIDNHAASGLVARTAQRLMQKTDRERSGVISTAQAQTHFLDSPRMTEVLGASSFDLGDLKSGDMTIFLVLPADRLATHGRWLRLV
ncbi:MAG: type IV secretory system conjugative DNA transfer family protein, partial [Alphaproteobacteria bacterium]|nr:type IV secretory system conjugative DNA transfer family protein [Alphaproteobacteria bacterium]